MATKFTIKTMAGMSQLFEKVDANELRAFENTLADEAIVAGVYTEARTDGLTFAQWQIVRNPQKELRSRILDLS